MFVLSGKWCDLTWLRKGLKFHLHELRKISAVSQTAVLTPKSGIVIDWPMTLLAAGCTNTKKCIWKKMIKNTMKEVIKDNDLKVIYVQVTCYSKD